MIGWISSMSNTESKKERKLDKLRDRETELRRWIDQRWVAWGRANIVRKPEIMKDIAKYENERKECRRIIREIEGELGEDNRRNI